MPIIWVPILTFVLGRTALIISFVSSMQTPEPVKILLVLKLHLAVVITSRIWRTLAVAFGVVPLVIVMSNLSRTHGEDYSWAFSLTLPRIFFTTTNNRIVTRKPATSASTIASIIFLYNNSLKMSSTFGIQTVVLSFQSTYLIIVPRNISISLTSPIAETHPHNINVTCWTLIVMILLVG